MVLLDMVRSCVCGCVEECCGNFCSCGEHDSVIGHGIVGEDIPIMARLAKARRWSKR